MTTLVLGIGNLIMMDDGVGVRVIQSLASSYRFPTDVRLLDGGTLGLDLLPSLEGVDRLLVVDAIDNGSQPGTLLRMEGDDVPMTLATKISPHQMGLKDLLLVAELQGHKPDRVVLIGVQPSCIEMGMELSPQVETSLPQLSANVLTELQTWGITPELF